MSGGQSEAAEEMVYCDCSDCRRVGLRGGRGARRGAAGRLRPRVTRRPLRMTDAHKNPNAGPRLLPLHAPLLGVGRHPLQLPHRHAHPHVCGAAARRAPRAALSAAREWARRAARRAWRRGLAVRRCRARARGRGTAAAAGAHCHLSPTPALARQPGARAPAPQALLAARCCLLSHPLPLPCAWDVQSCCSPFGRARGSPVVAHSTHRQRCAECL